MPSNLSKALEYYQASADKKDAKGTYHLALCYADGKAVEADRKKALRLCRSAMARQEPEDREDSVFQTKLQALLERLEK